MYTDEIVSCRRNVPTFQDQVNMVFQPEVTQEPHVHRLQDVLFNEATTPKLAAAHQTGWFNTGRFPDLYDLVSQVFQPAPELEPAHMLHKELNQGTTPKLAAAHQTGLFNTGRFPDNSELLSALDYADKLIACPDNWEGTAINDRVDKNYARQTTPEERHSRALDDAVQWLLKDRTTDLERFHMSKKFQIPGGHSFTADIAYQLPNGKWKIYKVEQAGHNSHGHGYRDAYRGDTTKYWRELFDWIGKKDCPIEVVQIIDVDFREPTPHAASSASAAPNSNHRPHQRCP